MYNFDRWLRWSGRVESFFFIFSEMKWRSPLNTQYKEQDKLIAFEMNFNSICHFIFSFSRKLKTDGISAFVIIHRHRVECISDVFSLRLKIFLGNGIDPLCECVLEWRTNWIIYALKIHCKMYEALAHQSFPINDKNKLIASSFGAYIPSNHNNNNIHHHHHPSLPPHAPTLASITKNNVPWEGGREGIMCSCAEEAHRFCDNAQHRTSARHNVWCDNNNNCNQKGRRSVYGACVLFAGGRASAHQFIIRVNTLKELEKWKARDTRE